MGGVWHATDLLDDSPPEHCDVGVPDRLCVASLDVGAPGLFSVLRVLTRRPCDATPVDGLTGGVRCRAPLFAPDTLGCSSVVAFAAAVVCGSVRPDFLHGCSHLLNVPPKSLDVLDASPAAWVDGGLGELRAGLAAVSFFADARVVRRTLPPGPVPAACDGGGVRSGVLLAMPPRPEPLDPGVGRGGARAAPTLSGPEPADTVDVVPGGVLFAAALNRDALVIIGAVLLLAAVPRASGGVTLAAVTAAYVGGCAGGGDGVSTRVGRAAPGMGGREVARRSRCVTPGAVARDRARTSRGRAPFPSPAGDCRFRDVWDPVPEAGPGSAGAECSFLICAVVSLMAYLPLPR